MINKAHSKKPLPSRDDGTTNPLRRLLTPREACEYGRFGHTRLYDLINTGKVKAFKDGARTKVCADSIDAMQSALPPLVPRTVA